MSVVLHCAFFSASCKLALTVFVIKRDGVLYSFILKTQLVVSPATWSAWEPLLTVLKVAVVSHVIWERNLSYYLVAFCMTIHLKSCVESARYSWRTGEKTTQVLRMVPLSG